MSLLYIYLTKITLLNMILIVTILVGFVAILHIYILVLEIFLWQKPIGRRAFGTTAEFAAATRVLAANQGLYNGFLAAGLLWGLLRQDIPTQLFFLSCVLVAGVFGGLTANRKILWVQALPALITLVVLLAVSYRS